MAKHDDESMNRLNSLWDEVVRGRPAELGDVDDGLAAAVRQLHTSDNTPAPDAAFASQVWQKLMTQPAPTKSPQGKKRSGILSWPGLILGYPGPGRMGARLAIAALVVVLAFVATVLFRPEPLGIPTVVAFEPDLVRGVPPQSPITLQFSTPMDRASVEHAFKLTPEMPGQLSWQGNAMTFTPLAPGFKRGTKYTVFVDGSALSAQEKSLSSPFEASFVAADDLAVLSVQPFKDSTEVGADSLISVQFNNPVAALTTAGAAQIDPLIITPPLDGKGRWLTTSVYTFRPTNGLAPATQYTVTVKKGITDTTGSALAAAYVWSFRTWAPAVIQVSPAPASKFVWVGTAITSTFNQPVDRAALQARFHLLDAGGREVAGSFAWPRDETVVFTPDRQLSLATKYSVWIDAGVTGAKGSMGMEKDFFWDFTTVDSPRLVSIRPDNGSLVQFPANPSIMLTFNQPMDRKSVLDSLDFLPVSTRVYSAWTESDTKLAVSNVITQPSMHYRVTLKAGALDRYGQRLAEGKTVELDTSPLPPSARLTVPASTISASSTSVPFAAIAAVNMDTVKLTLSAVDRATFINVDVNPWGNKPGEPAPTGQILRQLSIAAKGDLNATRIVTTPLSLSPDRPGLPPGLYMVQIDTGQTSQTSDRRGLVAVSRAIVTMKATSDEALVWVVDQVTGEPVRDSSVTLVDQTNQTLASGKTDAKGLFFAKFPAIKQGQRVYAVAEKDGDVALASTGWDWPSAISPYNFGLPYRFSGPNYAMALYTDRPIYRPGDKVYFRGVARADDDGKYSPVPADKKAAIVFRDPRYQAVFSQTLSLDEFGSFNGEFVLGKEAPTGNYQIQAAFDGDPTLYKAGMDVFSAGFLVAEFRKPDYEVKLSTDKQEYIQGDDVEVTVRTSYFFGAPLANAKVKWQVFQEPYGFQGPKDVAGGPYSFSDYEPRSGPTFNPGQKPIASGEGTTDASGALTFRLRADIAKETMGQVLTFEATAADANNQQVSGRSEAIVHKGTFYAGVRPNPRVVAAGKPAGIELLTVDTRAITVPNKALTIELLEQKWYSVQEKRGDGSLSWTSKVESTPVASSTATTDRSGQAMTSVTPPRAGSYKVLVRATDERGNEVRSSTYIYASGKEPVYWPVENNDRIELIADKPGYKPGDTAKVLIPSPYPKAKALLTIERGHVMEYKTIDITSNSQMIEIPIEAAHVPNVYVSVVLVRSEADGAGKADFKVGLVELPVQADEKKLTITITPDKARYQPRETATYKIKTTDFQGKPVQAELSLALVDASVLSLAGENIRDMFDSFYQRRPISVNTGQTLARSLNKVDPAAYGLGKGGGGESDDARGYFPDMAYWNPALKTDKNGEATVTIPLPDSLTTWRLTARGTTVDTIVGSQRNDIVVTKQVMVRPVTPRFFIVGDEVRLQAIVHNYTGQPLEADVSLAAQGVSTSDKATQRVKVDSAGTGIVYWAVKAGRDPQAKLTFQVQPVSPSGAPKDAVDVTLPILTYSSPEVTATSGEVRRTSTEEISLPANVDRDMGELTVKMEPSLASGMEDGLKYLESYPYESVEQTISQFLPNIVTLRALNKVGIDDAGLRDKLPRVVSLAVQRLYQAQNPDGSWGWWARDDGNPFITAYALYGLNEARREGFAVQPQVMDKAATYLSGHLAKSRDVYAPENPNLRAYILYVLAEAGRGDQGTTISLYERRDSLGRYGRAHLALALYILNGRQVDSRVKNLIEDLTSSAIASATGVHWEEASDDYRAMNTNNRTTSIVLDALVRLDPGNDLIPGAVRWLMVSRGEGHWETTQETAMAIIALTDYLGVSGELNPNYTYDVAINDKKVGGDTVTKANVSAQSAFVIPLSKLLVEETNKLRMNRYPSSGDQLVQGKLYYSLYLRYFLPADKIDARSEGIVVSREYLDLDDQPIKGAALGSTVKVKLTIVAPQDLHYVAIEDPLPAGAEAVDPALKTTSVSERLAQQGLRTPDVQGKGGTEEPAVLPPSKRRWQFTHIDIRDEKVAFFATFMPKGTYEYTYLVRTTTAGTYQALPLTAYEMYFPEVWGRSAGELFTVKP